MSSQYWGGAPESGLDCGGPAPPGWRRLGIKAKELRAYMAGFDPANWPAHLSCQSSNGMTETGS
jgi:hypothetical protein